MLCPDLALILSGQEDVFIPDLENMSCTLQGDSLGCYLSLPHVKSGT